MEKFKVGDWVYASDWCYGKIIEIDEDNLAHVEYNTGTDGGCMPFELSELELAKPPKKMITLRLTEDEFNMLVNKLSWMRCIVRDTSLNYEDYCNGDCNNNCNRKDLCNFNSWLKSKVISQ
jgi:hypothetical protein